MTQEEQAEIALQIMINSGEAKSFAYQALKAAKSGQFDAAATMLKSAEAEFAKAHAIQKSLLQQEAKGAGLIPSLLLVHAHGHVMTAQAERDLIEEMIELYRHISPGEPA